MAAWLPNVRVERNMEDLNTGTFMPVFPLMTHVNCMHCLPEIP